MLHETSVIEAVAASHVIGVLLGKRVEGGTIRIGKVSPNDRDARGNK